MSENDPYFSVVIPVFNRQAQLQELLKDLERQTFKDFEVVVVDDGSSDQPEKAIPENSGFKIRLIKQENLGGGAARNAGINASRGKYIAFLDSDDFFLPEKLEQVSKAANSTDADVYFSYARVDRGSDVFGIKPSRAPMPREPFEDYILIARQPAQTSTLVVRTSLAKSVLFDAFLKKFQDIDFAIRLSQASARIEFIPEQLTIWTDKVKDNRVGNKRRPEQGYQWLEKNKDALTTKAYYGFLANLQSYEIGLSNPFKAIYYIVLGYARGGVTLKRTGHSLIRALFPQEYYRPIINLILRHR